MQQTPSAQGAPASTGGFASRRDSDRMSALPPKPRYRRRRIFWLILLAAVLLIGIPTAFAAAPTMPWYPVQRLGENMTTALVPVPKVKQGLQAVFAARRVREAKVLAQGMRGQPLKVQEREEKMIGTLLDDYNRAFQEITISLGQQVDRGDKPPTGLFTTIENASTHLYLQLEDLRMIAPSAAQASVLQAQETAQGNLATLADALDHPPVSSDDAKELTSLVAAGLLSKDDLTKLISGDQSNREFLASLRTAVKNGTLPSNALAMIEYGQVAHYASGSIARFRAEVDFDEMRKIALLIKALTPTGAEKKSIEAALAKYVPGQPVAVGDQGQFLRPILLGFSLAPRLPADLTHLDPVSFEPGRKLFYETWKPLTTSKATDAKTLYSQALSLVDQNVARNTDLLEQIEFEVLNALRHDVVYAALPPGWTQEQVIKIQPAFKQLITDARTAETLQKQTAATTTSLIGMTAPLAVTLSNKQVEALRQETKSAMADMKKQLTALSMGVAVPNDTVTTINKKLDDLNTHVDQSLQGMTTSAAPATLTQEVAELRASLKQALDAAHTAMSDVQQQVATNVGISGALKQALTDLSTAHDQTRTELSRHVTALTQASGATAKMQQTVTDIMADSGKNVAALSSQITDALKSQATLKASLSQSIQDQADHAAELKAQLELSDAARQALKDEVVSTISTAKTAQDAVVMKLEKTIADNATLSKQSTSDITATIAAIKTDQASTLASLQTQVNDHNVLKSTIEASIADINTAQRSLTDDLTALKPAHATLSTFVQQLKTTQDKAVSDIQTNATEAATLRADLTKSLADVQASQTATVANLTNGLQSLGLELRQSLTDVQQAQVQTTLNVAALGTTVQTATDGLADLKAKQISAGVTLQTHTDTLNTLNTDVTYSIQQLQQAQSKTQADLTAVTSDVTQLKNSVQDIQATQAAAQTQINQLLAASVNWTQVPDSSNTSQALLDQVKASLDAEFTAKSTALEAQYQQYHAQLQTDVAKLKTETDAQILRLQQEATDLKAQLQAAAASATAPVTNTSVAPVTGL